MQKTQKPFEFRQLYMNSLDLTTPSCKAKGLRKHSKTDKQGLGAFVGSRSQNTKVKPNAFPTTMERYPLVSLKMYVCIRVTAAVGSRKNTKTGGSHTKAMQGQLAGHPKELSF